MKLKITLLLAVVSTASIFSQSGAKWATGGNSSSAGDFFGTTNNFPIDFKTNNVSRMNLSTTGILKLNNLAGTGSRLLQTDANGNIIFLPAGLSNQVLYGNGTWGPLPVIPSTVWQTNSFGTYYGGNVGIGLSNPQFALDVIGDAKISNNLIVGGGLIISQKVEATNSLKTDTVHSMTGETKFTSKVILKQQFQVDGTSLFNGTVQAGNLYVSGATNFANGANVNGTLNTSNLNVANNTTFVGGIIAPSINIGTSASPFNITTSSAANGAMVGSLGLIGPITFPPATCLSPPVAGDFYTQRLSIVKPTAVTSTNLLDFRNDGTNGYIDYGFDNTIYVAVVFDPITGLPITPATPPAPVLKINGACFGDVEIAKGGGVVSTGRNLEIGNPTRNYGIASNIKAGGAGIGQRITANSPYPDNNTSLPTTYNSQFFVNKNLTHVLSVFNTIKYYR
jgi:cytoskeletal protein CcmA (bactofilin family)